MDETQIRAVLALAMTYDHRKPGQSDIAAWLAAAEEGRWTLGEAQQAVIHHYTHEVEFLKPGHVTRRIKAERRHAPLPAERQVATAPPAEPERVRQAVAEIAADLGWPERATNADDPELRVRCPHEPCSAGIGRPCGRRVARGVHLGEFHPIRGYHPSRTETANWEK
ncbi:hypothetical protein [Amycolatopsis samaneae]|uniref:DNA-binding phage zinc finger domain-containing protein n=1 Tax=Amycolatopsis samaneae TaxID=664691 RepID=A0ABW5GXC5_9PSEU